MAGALLPSTLITAVVRPAARAASPRLAFNLATRRWPQHGVALRQLSSTAGTGQEGGGGLSSTLNFKTIVDGEPMTPQEFGGKAVLVVNTASLCG